MAQSVGIAVFVFDGISLFHLSVPSTIFNTVTIDNQAVYDLNYFSLIPGQVSSEEGVTIEVKYGLELLETADVIIIPAWKNPEQPAPEALTEALQKAYKLGKQIVGLCLGAFVLGDAGLLDHKEATTHWLSQDTFAERFPNVQFRPDVLYLDEGNIITSAGTVAAIDCCLHLVRKQHGCDLANHIARLLITPPHRQGGQAQYIERPVAQLPSEQRLNDALEWARNNLSSPLSIKLLADRCHMSQRNFTRRFRQATGATFNQWLTTERIAQAQRLLESTESSIELIAHEVGFNSAVSLRQQFSKKLGISPSDYRKSFYKALRLK
ncbi:MAG: helix-turn-helix domain-containing protein [Alcaligenaceae bacterium]|nr:helix-turn-helix domain-containing protein [Alcaligenaceae bacterium]